MTRNSRSAWPAGGARAPSTGDENARHPKIGDGTLWRPRPTVPSERPGAVCAGYHPDAGRLGTPARTDQTWRWWKFPPPWAQPIGPGRFPDPLTGVKTSAIVRTASQRCKVCTTVTVAIGGGYGVMSSRRARVRRSIVNVSANSTPIARHASGMSTRFLAFG